MFRLDLIDEAAVTIPHQTQPDVVSGYLHSYTNGTAVVSLWDSEPVTVRALPATYTGITTVSVLIDGKSRPIMVLGPTTNTPPATPQPPPSNDALPDPTGQLVRRTKVIAPTWSGTWRQASGFLTGWGKWGLSSSSYPNGLMQGSIRDSGTLTGLATYGDQLSGLDAEVMEVSLNVTSDHYATFTPLFQPAPHTIRPGGAPLPAGDTINVGDLAPGGKAKVAVPGTVNERFRTGLSKSLAMVGPAHGAVWGKGHPTSMSLSVVYWVRT